MSMHCVANSSEPRRCGVARKKVLLLKSRMSPGHMCFCKGLLGINKPAVSDNVEQLISVHMGSSGGETHLVDTLLNWSSSQDARA